ncbi:MAG TPA: TonB-dependent receptor [Gammaproteobacteria bacterium]
MSGHTAVLKAVRRGLRRNGERSVVVGVAALVAVGSAAQEPTGVQEEVLVTGSRIARNTFTTPAPVTSIDAAQIQAVGATNLGEYLARIPQTISEVNSSNEVFSVNASALQLTALRNLGSERTLVLVNGQRFVSGLSPSAGYAVDLNSIPVHMIERVEILTGGTSAVYGSDAVAGVVNIILRDDFEGVEISTQGYTPTEGDRERVDAALTVGSNFDRGNAWVSFGYSNDEGMKASDRSFSALDLAYFPEEAGGPGWLYLGSSFPPEGRFGDYLGTGEPYIDNTGGDPAAGNAYNRASVRDLASPVQRRLAAAGARYELGDGIDVSLDVNWSEVNIQTEFEPFPFDLNDHVWDIDRGGTGGLDVASSPLLPELLRQNLLADGITNLNQLGLNNTARRITEFGPRGSDIDRTTLRVAANLDVELSDLLTFNLFSTWGKTDVEQVDNVGINRERARFALDVVEENGTLVCADPTARLLGCVPLNVFGPNTISPEAVEYLRTPQNLNSEVEQLVVGAALSGDTRWSLAGGEVAYAVGLEYREEQGREIPDATAQAGITTSNRQFATDGSYDVTEAFGEIRLPVLERLAFEVAARTGDYSTVGNVSTWKIGIDSPAFDTLRFRATVSESVRAPNVADLFSGPGETFETLTDPCAGVDATTPGRVAENCRSIPAIANRIAQDGAFTLTQVEAQSTGGFDSGNPNVQEETADAFTVGIVWTPSAIQNLSLAADWYDIEVDDAITFVSRSDTALRCFDVDPAAFDPECGGRLRRDPTAGPLIEVNRSPVNEERIETSGLDLELAYTMDVGPGSLGMSVLYSYLREYLVTAIVSGDVNKEDGEVEFPKNRMNINLNYGLDRFNVDWRISVIDEVKDSNEPGFENIDVLGNPLPEEANTCSMRVYNDARVSYEFSDRINAFLGVNNLFDRQPCILGQLTKYGDVGINTNPSVYDIDGRAFYIGFNAQL